MKTSRSERTNLRKLPEVDKRNKESQNGPTVPDGTFLVSLHFSFLFNIENNIGSLNFKILAVRLIFN